LFKFFLGDGFTVYQNIVHYLNLKKLSAIPAAARPFIAVVDERNLTLRTALGTFHAEQFCSILSLRRLRREMALVPKVGVEPTRELPLNGF
jgi:hypothetical protein